MMENRDYKNRDKYSDCARSPKEKRMRVSIVTEHTTNHDWNSNKDSKSSSKSNYERDRMMENRDYKNRDKYSDYARSPKEKRTQVLRETEYRTNRVRNRYEVSKSSSKGIYERDRMGENRDYKYRYKYSGLRPQAPIPDPTPSLASYYRDNLVNHVRGWPEDLLEKQAQKMSEEAHRLGSMCTRVSAELKCARSVVRVTEIQATLQEHRILFLRQQIKNVEESKSQISFMAEEP